MIMTPYPDSDQEYENPDVIASNDGTTWIRPGSSSPLADWPGGSGSNGDPDLVVTPEGTMYAFWYETDGSTTCLIKYRYSTDGINWSAAATLFNKAHFKLTVPTFLFDGTGYSVWSVDISAPPGYVMERRTCSTLTGTYSSGATCTLNGAPSGKRLTHVEVIKRGLVYQGFFVFITYPNDDGILYFGYSSDGIDWTIQGAALLSPAGGSAWDKTQIYRASGIATASGYDLFYSAWNGTTNVWRIGRTPVTLT
jgi:hypothetical protein